MKRIPPPLMDFHAPSNLQAVFSLIAMLPSLEISTKQLSRLLPVITVGTFDHIVNQSDKNSQWIFLLSLTVSRTGRLSEQHSPFIFSGFLFLPLSELSSKQSICICQVMPLDKSIWEKQQQLAVCILITHVHNIQTVEEDEVFIIDTKILTPPTH